MEEITTTDFSKFGYREREEARDLLTASIEHGFPEDFNDEGVTIMFNTHSGNVFFTNEDYQVAMMTYEGKLESFYSCPQCGNEGFDDKKEYPFKKYEGYCSKKCLKQNN